MPPHLRLLLNGSIVSRDYGFADYIDAYRTKQYQLMRELTTWMRG